MSKGYAPFGPDGKKINLHHLIQNEMGGLAEMTQTFHQSYSRIIHINPSSYGSGIGRVGFNTFRRNYWKNRAIGFY
jgi:hypothetical protein